MSKKGSMRKLLAENIRLKRTELHLTQEKLAELADVHPLTVSKIENGEQWPKPETLEVISEVLNMRYYQLFFDAENDPVYSEEDFNRKKEIFITAMTKEFTEAFSDKKPEKERYSLKHKK